MSRRHHHLPPTGTMSRRARPRCASASPLAYDGWLRAGEVHVGGFEVWGFEIRGLVFEGGTDSVPSSRKTRKLIWSQTICQSGCRCKKW